MAPRLPPAPQDLDYVDILVAQSFNQMLNCLVTVGAAGVVLAIVTPYILLAGLPLVVLYYWVQVRPWDCGLFLENLYI